MKNAFCKWLEREFSGDVEQVARHLYDLIKMNPDANLVWELLDLTGEETYTADTFRKAARIALGLEQPEALLEEA